MASCRLSLLLALEIAGAGTDPRQLPPIGAGRPFLDIVKHVTPEGVTEKFPRVGPGYAELTIRRRQGGADREDLQLAEWFSGSPIAPGEDNVFDKVVSTGASKHVRFVEWTGPDDLNAKLIKVLVEELTCLSFHSINPARRQHNRHSGDDLGAVFDH